MLIARTGDVEPNGRRVSEVDLDRLFAGALDGWTVLSHSLGPFGSDGGAYVSVVLERTAPGS